MSQGWLLTATLARRSLLRGEVSTSAGSPLRHWLLRVHSAEARLKDHLRM